ncbi:PiggyBac transposable element-derived protein [Trinorchestia longiramus]|nr:PiggyBac transposable element-derived protein [Trinorchestia longiramus]
MSRRALNDRQILEILQSDDEDGNFSDITGASDDSVNDPNYKIDDDKTEESSDIEESADDTLASDEDAGQEEDSQQDEDEHQGDEDAREEKDDQQEEDEHQIEYAHQEDVENQASRSTKRKAKRTGMPSQKKQKTSEDDKETTVWLAPGPDLEPRLSVTTERNTNYLSTRLHCTSSEHQFFEELFPKSLFLWTAQCTNKRIDLLRQQKKTKTFMSTDEGEIRKTIGIMIVMAYNRVPGVKLYWSTNISLGNELIKKTMSRNRFEFILSKLYFNDPEKPEDSTKTYYISELVSCLKNSYQKAREDSPFHSMVKFKGRSSMKQYMPMKNNKRGIKLWVRNCAETGYVYDFDIYSGKADDDNGKLLGEKVVRKLCGSLRNHDVTIAFDRFFTIVNLMDTFPYPTVGTCILNRKNMPKFEGKIARGESDFLVNQKKTLAARWMDSKEVLVLSNCNKDTVSNITRKQKDGTKADVPCPNTIALYNGIMGGVNLSDQKGKLYDFNRKSMKWWKKVFYRLLLLTVVNAWILYQEVNHLKIPLLDFMMPLADKLIACRDKMSAIKKKSAGRRSSALSSLVNIGDHLPIEGNIRRCCLSRILHATKVHDTSWGTSEGQEDQDPVHHQPDPTL